MDRKDGGSMKKAVIFDVDGTLLDSMVIWDTAAARYLEQIGYRAEENINEILGTMSIEEGVEYLKEHYELKQSIAEIRTGFLKVIEEYYVQEAPPKAGVRDFLSFLDERKIPMIAATSGEKSYVRSAFARLGIEKYFQEILTCSEVGAGKTKPDIYQRACEVLKTDAKDTYVVEDALYAILTAKAAGFQTVGIYDASSWRDQEEIREQADYYFEDFQKVQKFMEEKGL